MIPPDEFTAELPVTYRLVRDQNKPTGISADNRQKTFCGCEYQWQKKSSHAATARGCPRMAGQTENQIHQPGGNFAIFG